MSDWQSIETLPEYGENVIGAYFCRHQGKWIARIVALERQFIAVDGGYAFPATYWMPLPPPPGAAPKQGETT